jgi:Na+-transporting NADH:ubiquinone oxidoreductase subunit C
MAEFKRDSTAYTIGFAALVCIVCALPIAGAAVALRPKQELNARLDRLEKVLVVAGLMERDESLEAAELEARFDASVVARAIDLRTGQPVDTIDTKAYDQRRASRDPALSEPAPENAARVLRVPHVAVVYEVMRDDALQAVILPIQGYGLWSTMYGFLALEPDARTVSGITFYEHGETAGLGGEIENPRWQAKWVGRRAINDEGTVALRVIKGAAGPAADDPYRVDGLSGATITGRGVSSTLDFWLGPNAFGPYLDRVRAGRTGATASAGTP